MMESIFGTTDHVSFAQACARATVIFLYGLMMMRLSGRRTFARMSALDLIVPVIAGSVLGQALTGAVEMAPALAGVGVLIFLHWGIAHLIARNERLAHLVEGLAITLARDGLLDERARLDCKLSRSELAEALRLQGLDGLEDLDRTRKVALETSGKISVIRRGADRG